MNSESIKHQYDEDGVVILRQAFSVEEIGGLAQHLNDFLRDVVPTLEAGDVYFENTPGRPVKSVFRMEQHDAYFQALSDDRRLRGLAELLLSDKEVSCWSVGFFGKPAQDGSVTPAHRDNVFQHWDPPEAVTLTIAVDESSLENGALICQRGTHRLGALPHRPSGVQGFSMALIEPPDLTVHPEVPLCMKPGDIAAHHITTVHRSDANRTDQSRRQIAIGYYSSRAKQDQDALAEYKARLGKLHTPGS
jgi:ectoine hydroxylase-related dioxygenase (phytanoyl-CoA dioxygenase family)